MYDWFVFFIFITGIFSTAFGVQIVIVGELTLGLCAMGYAAISLMVYHLLVKDE